MYLNDLVGKNNDWGPRQFLTAWQLSVYCRYGNMVRRCEKTSHPAYKNYGAKGINCRFVSLSHYYKALKKQTHVDNFVGADGNIYTLYSWEEFKRNPSEYEVDKDIRCGHGSDYAPDTIAIVSVRDNAIEHNTRTNSVSHMVSFLDSSAIHKASVSRGREVSVFDPQGVRHDYYGASEAARAIGIGCGTVSQVCNGKHKTHTIQSGKAKNYSLFWTDECIYNTYLPCVSHRDSVIIECVFNDGSVKYFNGCSEASAYFNRCTSLITMWANGKSKLPDNVNVFRYR